MKMTGKPSLVPVQRLPLCRRNAEAISASQYQRSARIMKELRAIKTALEIEVVQKAIDITHNTFRTVA